VSSGLLLVLVVAAAYLAAHVAFEFLARRFTIISGAEYLVLGVLLGPQVSGLIGAGVLDSFGPFMMLAIGWMGAAIGTRLDLAAMLRIRGPFYQVAFIQSVLSLAVVAGLMVLVLAHSLALSYEEVVVPGLVLGCIAAASSLSGLGVLVRRRLQRRPLVRQLQVASGMDACIAIAAFGLLLCIAHPGPPGEVRPPTPTEWAVISVGIGCLGGALFHLFLAGERNPDRLFISLTGAITLASGAAAYVRLSPLVPTLLIGAILVNTTRNRREITGVIETVQRPLYFILLVFAGAAWQPTLRASVLPILFFFVVRIIAKLGSARLAARASGMMPAIGPDWGRGLLGQGSLATAIALNYWAFDNTLLPNVVFTAALVSVLLTDVLSARFIQAAIRRHDEAAGAQVLSDADLPVGRL
jgi:hypothetical protein